MTQTGLVMPGIGSLKNKVIVPNKRQREIFESVGMPSSQAMMELRIKTPAKFECMLYPARYKGLWGGRSSGKSHFFAERLIELAAFDTIRAVCIREVQKSIAESVKLLLEDKIKKLGISHYFHITNTYIEGTKSKSYIIFQGMQNHTAQSIKSLEGYDIAWVEEAQALSELSLRLLRPTLRKTAKQYTKDHPLKGSELWFSWNPRYANDPIDALLRGSEPPPNAIVQKVNWRDNPWFPEELRLEMEYDRQRNTELYHHVWMGAYETRSEASVFTNWRIENFDTPKDARFYLGADWGFAVDPSVMVRCFIEGNKLFVDYEAYRIRCPLDQTPEFFALQVPGAREWPCRADSARPETIDYMKKHGYEKMVSARKGAGSVREGIDFLKKFDIIVHPRCRHTADELAMYKFKVDKKTDDILPVLADENNHVIDALRYAVEGERRASPKIGAAIQVH